MSKINLNTVKQNALFANSNKYRIKLLENCNCNPTIGAIAKQQFSVPQKSFFEKTYAEKYLENIVKEKIKSLYPKTKEIRKYIIDNNRLNLDFVTKSQGYNLLDRLKILLKKL